MNPYCECPATGFCHRHQKMKGAEQFARCQGTALTPDCGLKYWNAWEQGRAGATAPENPILNPPGFCGEKPGQVIAYQSSVGDMLSEIIKRETGKAIPCQACQDDIDKLNSLTIEECHAQKETYVRNIYNRAFEHANLIQKAGIIVDKLLHTGVTASIIGGWFDEAVMMGVEKKKHNNQHRQASCSSCGQ